MIPDISFEEDEETEEIEMTEETDESSSQVVRLVDQAIVTALRKNASDIHIEPSPVTNKTTIRFRLDWSVSRVYAGPQLYGKRCSLEAQNNGKY